MTLLKNRIGLSIFLIFVAVYLWEFHIKPVSGPIYTAAVNEYKNRRYEESLELLSRAYAIDPNDTGVLTLMGWNYLKLRKPERARKEFERSYSLDPRGSDTILGYAETEIDLKNYAKASQLLELLHKRKIDTADTHMAWGALYRRTGRNREAAREFKRVLALQPGDPLALKNLRQLYNLNSGERASRLSFEPVVRADRLAYPARVEGNALAELSGNTWTPVYLTGVDLTAALPGSFPAGSVTDSEIYRKWLGEISHLGVNTIRVDTILPPAFYRALARFNHEQSHPPLWLLQGVAFGGPPKNNDLYQGDYYQSCLTEIREAVDVVHGQGDVESNYLHSGGLYRYNISRWVAGFVVGNLWLSHIVLGNDALHPDMQSYQGEYVAVPSGNPTEIFLGEMIDHLVEYETGKYNWQHPVAFLDWPTLDPIEHATESSMAEEIAIRRKLGERFKTPPGPFDDDDTATVDPTHVKATAKFAAGYFADYNVFPSYPDFLDLDPGYLRAADAEGTDPFLGYLQDLKAHTPGLPLVISAYGIPSSLGVGHFNPVGFNEGGETERQQGRILARLTRNIYDAGAAGGMVFEWLDEWFRESWLTRDYETPRANKPRWTNFMDPAEYFGLIAADPQGRARHQLTGNPSAWAGRKPLYAQTKPGLLHPVGGPWDAARDLQALYVDSDEGFVYLRLVVAKLANGDGQRVDWSKVNYLIGISTDPGHAGLTYLPFIAPVRFPQGMTFAIQLAGPASSHLWIASSYNPYKIVPVAGNPAQTLLVPKLGWDPKLTGRGAFEGEIIEPNRRRFARNGKSFPPERYDRGILRYGTLDPATPDYDSLAEWHANVATHTIDVRIPWALLKVTDPSTRAIFAGIEKDGSIKTTPTAGFELAVFSYRPERDLSMRPIMEQGQAIADSLPFLSGKFEFLAGSLKSFAWNPWRQPQYVLREKASYPILRKAFLALPAAPGGSKTAARPGQGNPGGRVNGFKERLPASR